MSGERKRRISRRHLRRLVGALGLVLCLTGVGAGGYTLGQRGNDARTDISTRRILEIRETPEGDLTASMTFIPEEATPSMYPYRIPMTCTEALDAIDDIVAANPPTETARGPKPADRGMYEQINLIAQNVCLFGTYREYLIAVLHPWQYGTAFVDQPAVGVATDPVVGDAPVAADTTTTTTAPGAK